MEEITPGELVKREFLDKIPFSLVEVSQRLFLPPNRLGQIIRGKRDITPDTDLRLCRFLGISPGYFLRNQAAYDLVMQREKIQDILDKIKPYGSYKYERNSREKEYRERIKNGKKTK